MADENDQLPAPELGKLGHAIVWIISLSVIVGAPLLGWAWYESQSYTQELVACEVTDTNSVIVTGARGSSKEYLEIRSSCGDYRLDRVYAAEIFPGDTVELSVKRYPGGNTDTKARVTARAD